MSLMFCPPRRGVDMVSLPKPEAGLVVSYSYLWHNQHVGGEADGRKDRPCAMLLTVSRGARTAVAALAITHQEPCRCCARR
jgi:hypothetical protein